MLTEEQIRNIIMFVAPSILTGIAYAAFFLQVFCAKGGMWHSRRSIIIGVCASIAIVWNTISTSFHGTLLETWTLIHVSLGACFMYFWYRTDHLGRYAAFHCSQTDTHICSVKMFALFAIALFLVPFLLRYFTA